MHNLLHFYLIQNIWLFISMSIQEHFTLKIEFINIELTINAEVALSDFNYRTTKRKIRLLGYNFPNIEVLMNEINKNNQLTNNGQMKINKGQLKVTNLCN